MNILKAKIDSGNNSTIELRGEGGDSNSNWVAVGGEGGDGADPSNAATQGGNSSGSYGGQYQANGGNFGYNGDAIRVLSGSGSYSVSGNAAIGNVVTSSTVS